MSFDVQACCSCGQRKPVHVTYAGEHLCRRQDYRHSGNCCRLCDACEASVSVKPPQKAAAARSRIERVFPIDPGNDGLELMDRLARFLCDDVAAAHGKNTLDLLAGPLAARIMKAFAAYEKTGTVAAFEKELRKK